MVVLGALCLAGPASAGERAADPKAPAADAAPKPQPAPTPPSAAKALGVTEAELKRLHELGFADSEIVVQVNESRRTARQIIQECEVVSDVAYSLAEAAARINLLPKRERAAERDRSMKSIVARARRDHKVSRDDLRRILSATNLFTPDDLRRALGPVLFRTDELRRVFFNTEDDERSPK
jgi:hypothetical protein